MPQDKTPNSRNTEDRLVERWRRDMYDGVPPYSERVTFLVSTRSGGTMTARWRGERLIRTRNAEEVDLDDVTNWIELADDPFAGLEAGIQSPYWDDDLNDRANAGEELRWHGDKPGLEE